jgi:hypothetical protein
MTIMPILTAPGNMTTQMIVYDGSLPARQHEKYEARTPQAVENHAGKTPSCQAAAAEN